MERFDISQEITSGEITRIIKELPNGKATGPDGIPNEILKALVQKEEWEDDTRFAKELARSMTEMAKSCEIPPELKESITIALKKLGKADYSVAGAYRPIALENTMAKVFEKILANRVTKAAEDRNLLSWNQMGARRNRSTISAVQLLQGSIESAWHADKKCIISVLGLDIKGAFDNMPHEILLNILRKKGYPEWLVKTLGSFMSNRTTRISFTGYQSRTFTTNTGIPQGSPLSPILFLLYISELLEKFQTIDQRLYGFGFVDDTTLVTWSHSAGENCKRLEDAHKLCNEWAQSHGAEFAPEKYQLMHFTRGRQDEDLRSTVQIDNARAELMTEKMRLLGIWMDPKLSWKPHMNTACLKGRTQLEALQRVAGSTWGPSVQKTRLLYTAVVRPTLTYGAQVWHEPTLKGNHRSTEGLQKIQSASLRTALGAYKRTPRMILASEAAVEPLPLYLTQLSSEYAIKNANSDVRQKSKEIWSQIWEQCQNRTGRRRPRHAARPPTTPEAAGIQAKQLVEQGKEAAQSQQERNGRERRSRQAAIRHQWRNNTVIRKAIGEHWKTQWLQHPKTQAVVWQEGWGAQPLKLYRGLTKAEATALFQLGSEVIGLRGWLAGIGLPVSPICECGRGPQTVKHVLTQCENVDRERLLMRTGTQRHWRMLTDPSKTSTTARWFVDEGILEQFQVAKQIDHQDRSSWRALPSWKQMSSSPQIQKS